ncbi:MAG: hypothetical protein Q9M36_11880 [Sulfurovum sp.]|nr:hypothetical protein [Sulfurovum sp.]
MKKAKRAEAKKKKQEKQARILELKQSLKEVNKALSKFNKPKKVVKKAVEKVAIKPKVKVTAKTKPKEIKQSEKKIAIAKIEKPKTKKRTNFDDINLTQEKLDATIKADQEYADAVKEMNQE